MDKTKKIRLFIDIAMAAVFLILLNSTVTGVLLHEILGIAITVLFIAHLAVNRKWITGITRKFKSVKLAVRAAYVFDAVIAASTGVAILSGVLISKFLLPALASGNSVLWYTIHIISSYLAFFLLIVHAALHLRWVRGIMQTFAKQTPRVKVIASRTVIGLISAAAVYTLIANDSLYRVISPSAQAGAVTQTGQTTEVTENYWLTPGDNSGSTGINDTAVTAAPATGDQVTLQDFLSKLYCTGCHRHCPLTNPQCSVGVRQAEEQTVVYNAQYGQE